MRLRASLELVSSEEAFPRFTPLLWTIAAADFAPSTRTELQLWTLLCPRLLMWFCPALLERNRFAPNLHMREPTASRICTIRWPLEVISSSCPTPFHPRNLVVDKPWNLIVNELITNQPSIRQPQTTTGMSTPQDNTLSLCKLVDIKQETYIQQLRQSNICTAPYCSLYWPQHITPKIGFKQDVGASHIRHWHARTSEWLFRNKTIFYEQFILQSPQDIATSFHTNSSLVSDIK